MMRPGLMATLLLAQRGAFLLPATEAFSSCSILLDCGRQKKLLCREKEGLLFPARTKPRRHCSVVEDENHHHRERAAAAFSVLARKNKTWKRLGPLVEMAASRDASIKTIADVGTDHGLLAMGLALSGRYEKVLGVDVSQPALRNGAISLLEDVNNHLLSDIGTSLTRDSIPLDFRLSNGLEAIGHGEADAICIAGMGVNTMIKILEAKRHSEVQLHRIGCRKLLVQPTNSRPRNLANLYDYLQTSGWRVSEERIEKLSSRWYISVSFVRESSTQGRDQDSVQLELPASKLALLEESDPMHQTFQDYVAHHCRWIQQDAAMKGNTNEADRRWVERFCTMIS